MKTRIITGAVFGIIFLSFLLIGNLPFLLLVLTISGIGCFELYKMSKQKAVKPLTVVLSMLYISGGFYSFWFLREGMGFNFIMYLMIIIWATDSFAYFVGRKYGKTNLAPVISPNKTWEGSIGGTVLAITLAGLYQLIFKPLEFGFFSFILFTLLLSVSGQIGDLIESAYKRYAGVKDSGNVLPGHGGVLDRFDSLLLVSIVGVFLVVIF
ncbi:phosphatidate cytidylyltransferase [[Brevibacterium] frigoritolerans]|nr:phosphatidate cytidylyltransferase [Peribacillus frigoritolerans]